MNQTPQTLKGFRDFLPSSCRVRNYVKNLLIETFETFGFQPLETPALEYASTLMGKYGDEADKLVYTFKDQGNRDIGLRYDLTVPVSRVLAQYNRQISLPFKRYQIQPVWRAENTQKGRYREILQCDIDIFGPQSPINDAEIIAIIYNILQKLNFKRYSIRINSRTVLFQILALAKITDKQNSALQSIDKLNKIGEIGVKKELNSKGLSDSQIQSLFDYIKQAQPDDYLRQVFDRLNDFNVPSSVYTFDPSLVRGLDYYTGPIFETYVEEPRLGSITGGGRYDKLVSQLGGPDIPAVGTTIGLDRIVDCITELNLLPNLPPNKTKVLVTNFSPDTEKASLELVSRLRDQNIPSFVYPTSDKISKQLKYANSLAIPYVVILGPDEIKSDTITLKNMPLQTQQTIPTQDLTKFLL
jgi:histidyl-tRNA synthetase